MNNLNSDWFLGSGANNDKVSRALVQSTGRHQVLLEQVSGLGN